jgi:hypothetical protein
MLSSRSRRAFAFGLPFLLLGCQNFAAITPGTPSAALIERFGAPNVLLKNSDGSEVWEYPQDYPRAAYGYEKFLIDIGADGKVRMVRQVLTEEYLSKVRVGMSRDDVRRILGTPHQIAVFERRNEEVWTWPYRDTPADVLFHVYFDRAGGTVKQILRFDDLDKAMVGD